MEPLKKLEVILRSVGNPDFGQDPEQAVWGVPTKRTQVRNLEEASSICKTYIQQYGLGSGNWAGGAVLEEGEIVAYISYNGRIWTDPEHFPPGIKDILVPPVEQGPEAALTVEYETLVRGISRGLTSLNRDDFIAVLLAKGLISVEHPETWDKMLDQYLVELSQSVITALKQEVPELKIFLDGREVLKQS